jgi:thioredoxin 1
MKTQNKRRLFSVLMVAFMVSGLLLAGCSGKKENAEAKKVSSVTSNSVISNEKLPKMVDFWSPTCPPCRKMLPILEELHLEYGQSFTIVKIDTSLPENRTISIENKIQYIPTQIFYDENGKLLDRHVGFYSKEDILNKWKELGYEM